MSPVILMNPAEVKSMEVRNEEGLADLDQGEIILNSAFAEKM
jgi:hypothetical protein